MCNHMYTHTATNPYVSVPVSVLVRTCNSLGSYLQDEQMGESSDPSPKIEPKSNRNISPKINPAEPASSTTMCKPAAFVRRSSSGGAAAGGQALSVSTNKRQKTETPQASPRKEVAFPARESTKEAKESKDSGEVKDAQEKVCSTESRQAVSSCEAKEPPSSRSRGIGAVAGIDTLASGAVKSQGCELKLNGPASNGPASGQRGGAGENSGGADGDTVGGDGASKGGAGGGGGEQGMTTRRSSARTSVRESCKMPSAPASPKKLSGKRER